MYLKKVVLDKFKKHNHLEIEFVPGINVIKGRQNEAGKSTLLDGIIAAFFSRPDSTSKELDQYIAWDSGSVRDYMTTVEFVQGDDSYRLEKNFKDETTILAINDEQKHKTYKKTLEVMKEVFGVFPEKEPQEFYSNTACIKQNDVVAITLGMKEMGPVLEQVVMTGNTDSITASQLIPKLEKRIRSLRTEIKSNEAEIQRISKEREEIKTIVERVEKNKIERNEAENKLSVLNSKYKELNGLLEKNKQKRKIQESIDTLKKQHKVLHELVEDIEELQKKQEETENKLSLLHGFTDEVLVNEVAKGIEEIEVGKRTINDDLVKLNKEVSEAETRLAGRTFNRFSTRTFIVIALVAVIISVMAAILVNPFALFGLIIAILSFILNGSLVRERTKLDGFKIRVKKMEDGLREQDSRITLLLNKVTCSSVAEFNNKKAIYNGYLDDRIKWRYQLQGKLGRKTLESIRQERSGKARELAIEQAKLTEDLGAIDISPERYISIETEVNKMMEEKNYLEDKIRDDSASIRAARYDVEQKNVCDERLDGLQEKNKSLQRQIKTYEMVRDVVMQARNDILRSPGGVMALEKETQNYLSIFTGGRYNQVRMENNSDKQKLEFEIFSDEKKDWVSPDKLSKGTIDESYLACRLALVKLIYGDKRPPLILDDPLVNFDDIRLARTMSFLKELSKEYQIIIFTLRDIYDSIADKIIPLEGN